MAVCRKCEEGHCCGYCSCCKSKQPKPRKRQAGLTLIELLCILAFIGICAGLVGAYLAERS